MHSSQRWNDQYHHHHNIIKNIYIFKYIQTKWHEIWDMTDHSPVTVRELLSRLTLTVRNSLEAWVLCYWCKVNSSVMKLLTIRSGIILSGSWFLETDFAIQFFRSSFFPLPPLWHPEHQEWRAICLRNKWQKADFCSCIYPELSTLNGSAKTLWNKLIVSVEDQKKKIISNSRF